MVKGNEVATFSHYAAINARQFDVVHVHHLSYGTTRVAEDNSDAPFVMSRADAVVALSRAEADFHQRNYPLAGAIHTVIPNGIDVTNYAYARKNTAGKDSPWQLLYVGQLIETKNVDVLLRALALLGLALGVLEMYSLGVNSVISAAVLASLFIPVNWYIRDEVYGTIRSIV